LALDGDYKGIFGVSTIQEAHWYVEVAEVQVSGHRGLVKKRRELSVELPGSDGLFQRIAPPVSCALRPFTTVFGTGTGGTTALQPPGSLGGFIDCRRYCQRTRESESVLGVKALDREHDFASTLTRCPHVASQTGSLPAVLPA
jgi:hypothetical protein